MKKPHHYDSPSPFPFLPSLLPSLSPRPPCTALNPLPRIIQKHNRIRRFLRALFPDRHLLMRLLCLAPLI